MRQKIDSTKKHRNNLRTSAKAVALHCMHLMMLRIGGQVMQQMPKDVLDLLTAELESFISVSGISGKPCSVPKNKHVFKRGLRPSVPA